MRIAMFIALSAFVIPARADEVESRVFTHYIPQDFLEKMVRTEGWTEVPIELNGNVRKGDTVRVWAGGCVDRGNGDQPGENISLPPGPTKTDPATDTSQLALSKESANAYAILCKTESGVLKKCHSPGKPLELGFSKDKERLFMGFNDLRGHYQDNHLGKGTRHEFDPLWIRIEVVRTIVD
jgi:hypothetical protein